MKPKIRLDLTTIKDFIVHHVEKGILAVVVIFFALFVYSAIGREPLGFTPAELDDIAKRAKDHVREGKPEPWLTKLPNANVNYLEEARRIRTPTQVDPYQYPHAWDPPLFGVPVPKMPQLYTVRSLRGDAGYGAMTVDAASVAATAGSAPPGQTASGSLGPMGGWGRPATSGQLGMGMVVGERWVVLTGLIDMSKQAKAYNEAFAGTIVAKTAQGPGLTGLEPDYRYVGVQRVEVPEDGKIDESKWEWVDPKPQLKLVASGASMGVARGAMAGSDVVDPSFLTACSYVTFPLGSVVNHRWGPEVAHPPEIPLQAEMQERLFAEQQRLYADGQKPQEDGKQGEGDKKKQDPNLPPEEPAPGTAGISPMGLSPMGLSPMGIQPAAPQGEDRRKTGNLFGGALGPGLGGMPMAGAQNSTAPVRLFRFFDFSVQPGKHYRYRVNLVLKNPASGVAPQFLPAELADQGYLKSAWSEPSPVISVPRDSRLLAGTVKSPRSVTAEPSSNLTLVHFDAKTGSESSVQISDVQRGQLVNYIQETELIKGGTPEPDVNSSNKRPAGQASTSSRKANPQDVEIRTDVYHSENLVLDMLGGDRLTTRDAKLTKPGSVLLLNPDGTLIVHNETDDMSAISRYKLPEPAGTAAPSSASGKAPRERTTGTRTAPAPKPNRPPR